MPQLKLKDAKKRARNNVIRGTRLNPNAGDEAWYRHELLKLVRRMNKKVLKEVTRLFRSTTAKNYYYAMDDSIASQARILLNQLTLEFESLFGRKSKPLSEEMVNKSNYSSRYDLKRSLKKLTGGLTLSTNILTTTLKEVVKGAVNENVNLIKSIPSKYLDQIKGAVTRSITTGNGLEDLVPAIQKYNGMTERRARNIALDQTRKVYNSINAERVKSYGVMRFEWVHSGGGHKPRPHHLYTLNGQIFSYSREIPYEEGGLPVIDLDTEERGIPGQLPNCGCTMIPVIELNEDTEEE